MAAHERRGPSYQVAVQGELRPPVLVFCAGPRAHHQTSGVFRLQVHDEQGIADLVAMLQTAGMMILSIRQVTPAVVAGDVTTSASVSS
ncbi:hypothetical protein [Kribbella pratensis]|jgi:hypothetical protein|uniref:ACT domain-containing protein n=1 Tax=Kribbella pratensis TaxID=2512112 RepID=A0A4R8CMC6_9ACTN|nr:hypothetical protein [Kribbella pratensis]TDW77232.1 hypothetical protein EV653_2397 [Kribbella pratensis]